MAFNAIPASALTYKITFSTSNYQDQNTPTVPGTLNGFVLIDTDLGALDSTFSSGQTGNGSISIPNWIRAASLTFTSDETNVVASETRSLTSAEPLERMMWKPNATARANGGVDFSQEFIGQMERFSFTNFSAFGTSFGLDQEFSFVDASGSPQGGEFELTSPSTTERVPGPLPILGLLPIFYYYKKFKKKSIKL